MKFYILSYSFSRVYLQCGKQSKAVDTHPLCWLEFTEEAIITSCKNGKPLCLAPRCYKPQRTHANMPTPQKVISEHGIGRLMPRCRRRVPLNHLSRIFVFWWNDNELATLWFFVSLQILGESRCRNHVSRCITPLRGGFVHNSFTEKYFFAQCQSNHLLSKCSDMYQKTSSFLLFLQVSPQCSVDVRFHHEGFEMIMT